MLERISKPCPRRVNGVVIADQDWVDRRQTTLLLVFQALLDLIRSGGGMPRPTRRELKVNTNDRYASDPR